MIPIPVIHSILSLIVLLFLPIKAFSTTNLHCISSHKELSIIKEIFIEQTLNNLTIQLKEVNENQLKKVEIEKKFDLESPPSVTYLLNKNNLFILANKISLVVSGNQVVILLEGFSQNNPTLSVEFYQCIRMMNRY